MRKEKGQDIIEYALMLAMVVGIGFGIYSYGGSGIGNSISTVFNNAGNLLDKAALPVASSADDIIRRLGDGRYKGLADLLKDTPANGSKPVDISSDSAEGQALAQKLNIQTPEGDGWFARINTKPGGVFVVSYYSAADNGGVTFSQLKNAKPGDKEYLTKINIHEGIHNGSGKETYNTANTGRQYDVGHVVRDSNGQFVSIYPGAK